MGADPCQGTEGPPRSAILDPEVSVGTVILACDMLKLELEKVMAENGCGLPVHWLDTHETHSSPEKLRLQLQGALDGLEGVERVLLAFGYCGNALLGLRAGDFELIFPRVDDCISLLLGSCARRQEIAQEAQSYFMTQGWVDSPLNLWEEYRRQRPRLVARWGEERAERALRAAMMPEHYKRLVLIDTGAFKVEEVRTRTEEIARGFGLRHEVLPGTTDYLRRLILGPWGEGFVTVGPGNVVLFEHVVGKPLQQ